MPSVKWGLESHATHAAVDRHVLLCVGHCLRFASQAPGEAASKLRPARSWRDKCKEKCPSRGIGKPQKGHYESVAIIKSHI